MLNGINTLIREEMKLDRKHVVNALRLVKSELLRNEKETKPHTEAEILKSSAKILEKTTEDKEYLLLKRDLGKIFKKKKVEHSILAKRVKMNKVTVNASVIEEELKKKEKIVKIVKTLLLKFEKKTNAPLPGSRERLPEIPREVIQEEINTQITIAMEKQLQVENKGVLIKAPSVGGIIDTVKRILPDANAAIIAKLVNETINGRK